MLEYQRYSHPLLYRAIYKQALQVEDPLAAQMCDLPVSFTMDLLLL